MKKLLLVVLFLIAIPVQSRAQLWTSMVPMIPIAQQNPTWCVHACVEMITGMVFSQWQSVCIYLGIPYTFSPDYNQDAGVALSDIASHTGTVLRDPISDYFYSDGIHFPIMQSTLPGIIVDVSHIYAHAMVVNRIENWNGYFIIELYDPWYGGAIMPTPAPGFGSHYWIRFSYSSKGDLDNKFHNAHISGGSYGNYITRYMYSY